MWQAIYIGWLNIQGTLCFSTSCSDGCVVAETCDQLPVCRIAMAEIRCAAIAIRPM